MASVFFCAQSSTAYWTGWRSQIICRGQEPLVYALHMIFVATLQNPQRITALIVITAHSTGSAA